MPRVLVIEDDPGTLEILSRVLTLEGYEVETAPTGKAALACVQDRAHDVVLLDLMLPDADGVLLQARLRRLRPDLQHRIIFMTGFTSREPVIDYLKALGAGFLHKPFAAGELVRAVERVARSRGERAATAAVSRRS